MKKIILLITIISLLVCTGCNKNTDEEPESPAENKEDVTENTKIEVDEIEPFIYEPEFESLADEELLPYLERSIYSDIVQCLPDQDFFIDNVETRYISKEYIEELEYNSKSNIFFGYTLKEIEEEYKDSRYIFTLENGQTVVKPFEDYDDSFEKAIKNVAIGSGVILICVTVSVVSGGVGAPAINMIFAASAKTGTIAALSSGTISAAVVGITTGLQTGDMEKAMKSAALTGSESFKWAAFTGAVAGGATEAVALKGATLNGLSMNEATTIQKESKYPLDMIKEFHNTEEYSVFKEAGLKAKLVNGRSALIRNDIDLDFIDEYGRTNLQRMKQGLAPLEKTTGNSFQLHHVGQKNDGTLAILTDAEHNNSVLHGFIKASEIERADFANITRPNFWKTMARLFIEGDI